LFEAFKSVIVIDPGHGGQDFGAKGSDGTLEKAVTMALARLIASQLEPEFKVVLTRTDDYQVELHDRTSLANHLKADIFISIHTGAGFVHSTTGTLIYYYQNFSQPDAGRGQGPVPADSDSKSSILWKNIQTGYIEQSRTLARAIDDRLKPITAVQSRTEGSPLAVLQGAAMPAVLIEVGYLTNPAQEKKLSDIRFLTEFAEQIRLAIEDFIEQNK
jgi:N-acetylmuramoyl-L-alanine amidase